MTALGVTWTYGLGRQELSIAQFEEVKRAAAPVAKFQWSPNPPLAPDVVWQANHILVSDTIPVSHVELGKLGAVLAKNFDGTSQSVRPGFAVLLKIDGDAAEAVKRFNDIDQFRGKVWLNHLVSICPVNVCPADEPIPNRSYPATVPVPAWNSGGTGGLDVEVKVIDTGLAIGWDKDHPWLDPSEVKGMVNPTYDVNGEIELYAGHGEFIAGVLRCVAPRVRVDVSDALRWAGATTEFEIRNALLDALNAPVPPDIIVLSAGCTTEDGGPPQALKEVVDRMRQPGCETLLVAAAGNDGLGPGDDPRRATFYPAAFAGDPNYAGFVVAVGALRQNRHGRACFSNYSAWVSVYEDGERLVNAYPEGKYTYHEPVAMTANPPAPPVPYCIYYKPPPLELGCTCVTALMKGTQVVFDGMAFWSGTSFSTPITAGRIAKHMTELSVTHARVAWSHLKTQILGFTDTDGAQLKKFLL